MEKKLTWDDVYRDFCIHFPNLKKEVLYWKPYDYATILVYVRELRWRTYNYDTKECRKVDDQ